MANNVIHISEAEAASDFASVMAPVRAGAEIVIDRLGLRSRRGRNHQEPQTVGSASMGVILDSSVIIAAERRGRTVPQILEQMTAPERQKVVEKTPKQSFRTTVGPRFFFWSAVLQRVAFCQSRLLRAVSLCL